MRRRLLLSLVALAFLSSGCASNRRLDDIPYPAFVKTDELQDTFLAALPGVRAKPYSSDIRTGALSSRVDIPPDWTGTTGAAPGKAVEIYVISGTLWLSEFKLQATGYAYIPPGSLGFKLQSDAGAQILYFLDEPDPRAHIRSPIIMEKASDWQSAIDGVSVIMLRADTGNGSRSWLRRVRPGTREPWESSSAMRVGYLVSGEYTTSECLAGEAVTSTYQPGGYFRRPAGAVSGGPEANAISEVIWFFREGPGAAIDYHEACPFSN